MSRFFRGESDSESESESDESLMSEEEESQDEAPSKPATNAFARTTGRRGMADSDSDSDSNTVRVVKSAKDKRFEEMRNAVKSLENAKKINDWVAVQHEFDRLNKAVAKASNIFAQNGGTPRFYIRSLVQLEDFLKETQEKGTHKKMNVLNAKSFNAMKQKLRKHNKTLESNIEEYRKNPVLSDDEQVAAAAESESESESEVEEKPKPAKKIPEPKSKLGSDGDSDSEWPSDSEDSESESDAKVVKGAGRSFWTKDVTAANASKKPIKKEKDTKEEKDKARAERQLADAATEPFVDDGFTQVGKAGKIIDITKDNFFKRLRETTEARGKKNTDRTDQIRTLQRLLEFSTTPYQRIKVLFALISSQFDSNPSMAGYMSIDLWKNALTGINSLFAILEANPQYTLRENAEEPDLDKSKPEDITSTEIRGSVLPFVERLDDEWIKSLQNIDPHTTEYVDRLKDEVALYAVIVRAQAFFERTNVPSEESCRAIMRRVEHLYYKPDAVIQLLESSAANLLPKSVMEILAPQIKVEPKSGESVIDSENLIHSLCVFLYKNSPPLHRTRAMLCHVYHHALHGKFHTARDLLLMSHLQESIHNANIATQILYNRTMVQLGICAFRRGLIKDSHACLMDISATGRVKELLAQGVQMQRHTQITPEQEKQDRLRQLPFHMHINLELMECIFLVCSMLLEIPNMAMLGSSPDARKKAISKPFRRMLDYNERQVFTGPPENTRDHIMGASKALAAGEWQKCRNLIHAIKIWDLMPEINTIKPMLTLKIQEEGLRTYLFTYAAHYTSVSIDHLATSFDLTPAAVHSIVAKMIHSEELAASFDETRKLVKLHRIEPTRAQSLALAFADKANAFVEANERVIEHKHAMDDREGKDPTESLRGSGDKSRGGPRKDGGQRRIGGRGGRGGGGRRGTFDGRLGNRVQRGGDSRRGTME